MHFFEEMKNYVGFDETDAQQLQQLRPVVEPHFDDIVDHFYDALLENDRTRNIFSDDQQVDRLRHSLHDWLEEVFAGPYDDDYYQRRRRIGQVHVDVGLLPRFMFGAMNLIRSDILQVLDEADCSIQEALSVERILDLELTVMVQAYWDKIMEKRFEVPVTLATGLAHEIRNPLNTLKLQMTLLRRRIGDLKPGAEEALEPIIESVEGDLERIRGLTNDISDYAKPLDLDCDWHSVDTVAEELEQAYRASLETLDIDFQLEYTSGEKLWCDFDHLKQAITNLIQNAVQAIDGEGCVRLEFRTDDKGARVAVKDTGQGISSENKYDIFDMFFTTKASGTGLGLPIVRKIMRAHDGTVEVDSEPNEGTRFMLYLPFPNETDTNTISR